ncbi:MAG: porin [Methylophilaceae bacterium]
MKVKVLALSVLIGFASSGVMAASIEDKIDLLQEEIEQLKLRAEQADKRSAGGIQGFVDRTTIGGYGELHYNNYRGDTPAGKKQKNDEIDFHRFVLFFGHKFNDWISFKSELELEHAIAGDGKAGEIELEQAYLDFALNNHYNVKAGLFLIPMGLINETHEPPTFYGVERNEVEKRIIPSTWWEAGAGVYGEVTEGLNYQVNVTSSLNANKFKTGFADGVRGGRQKVGKANAENLAVSGALNYNGIPGLTFGGAFFTGETGQNVNSGVDARLTLWDVHARYQKDRLDMRALYAKGHLSDAAELKDATGINAAEDFYGWYAEAAYHVWKHGEQSFAPFVRYEKWDTHADVPNNVVRNNDNKNNIWTIGANYYPHPSVVVKADYQKFDDPDGSKGDKRLNLGLGYMF